MLTSTCKAKTFGEDVVTQPSLSAARGREQKPMTIDEDHLGRMTLGDRSLEREVLEIFARQTTLMMERMAGASPAIAAAAAHTLKGSARGIGAWRVASAAEQLEQAAAGGGDAEAMRVAKAELEAASFETRAAIGRRLAQDADVGTADGFGGGSRDH